MYVHCLAGRCLSFHFKSVGGYEPEGRGKERKDRVLDGLETAGDILRVGFFSPLLNETWMRKARKEDQEGSRGEEYIVTLEEVSSILPVCLFCAACVPTLSLQVPRFIPSQIQIRTYIIFSRYCVPSEDLSITSKWMACLGGMDTSMVSLCSRVCHAEHAEGEVGGGGEVARLCRPWPSSADLCFARSSLLRIRNPTYSHRRLRRPSRQWHGANHTQRGHENHQSQAGTCLSEVSLP